MSYLDTARNVTDSESDDVAMPRDFLSRITCLNCVNRIMASLPAERDRRNRQRRAQGMDELPMPPLEYEQRMDDVCPECNYPPEQCQHLAQHPMIDEDWQ